MESVKISYPFRDIIPSLEMIERTMGYRDGETPEPVRDIVKDVIDEIFMLDEARAEYRIFSDISFDKLQKSVRIEEEIFAIKPIIFSQIRKSEQVALFICTAGETISSISRESMKGKDLLKGYIYDVVGSEIVETAADMMQDELRQSVAAAKNNITNRFSPGYCGWDVAQQHSLFRFFPDNFCKISLTESALMSPVKSVSGIIGIGSEVNFAPYQCKVCEDKNCIYRNRKR